MSSCTVDLRDRDEQRLQGAQVLLEVARRRLHEPREETRKC